MTTLTRRNFLSATVLGALGAMTVSRAAAEAAAGPGPVCLFTKPLDHLPAGEICGLAAEAGFKALDLTVRKNGHIKPDTVEKDLPAFIETARQAGLTVPLMVCALTGADDPDAQRVLKTAASAGIKAYRMGYLPYDEARPPRQQIPELHGRLAALAALNAQLGIGGLYQNHAGRALGAAVWDLSDALQGIDPAHMGCQYDVRHASVEGAESWPLGLRQIASHVRCLAVKDYRWEQVAGKWTLVNVPLGEGMVDFPRYFGLVKQLGLHVPVSLHLEYDLLTPAERSADAATQRKAILVKLRRDREWLAQHWKG